MARYFDALRTSRQLFPRTRDWLAFLDARLRRKLRLPMPPRLAVREFRITGLDEPVLLRPHTADFQVAREMFVRQEYQRLMQSPPVNVRFVLDLGANIGLSVRLWQRMFPEARIVALEPDHDNAQLCGRNVELSGAADRVLVIEAAAAAQSGLGFLETGRAVCSYRLSATAPAADPTALTALSRSSEPQPAVPTPVPDPSLTVAARQTTAAQVQTLSIPDVLQRAGHAGAIDLLKCDIEGGEEALFADCGAWIGRVRALIVEVHARYTIQRLESDLKRSGSALRVMARDHRGPEHALGYFCA